MIRGWSKPLPYERDRDDQGIGTRNPDTGSFVYYNLAGAYDSNIALVLCDGTSRRNNLERLAEILQANGAARRQSRNQRSPSLRTRELDARRRADDEAKYALHDAVLGGGRSDRNKLARDVDLGVAAAELMLPEWSNDLGGKKALAAQETLFYCDRSVDSWATPMRSLGSSVCTTASCGTTKTATSRSPRIQWFF